MMGYDGGPGVTWYQLTHFASCSEWSDAPAAVAPPIADCAIFADVRPKTVALSILVAIEMLNSLNALSENESLLRFPPSRNPWLLGAIGLSFAQHFVILYFPWFNAVFGVLPLSYDEWKLVFAVSVPVILLDEILKLITRMRSRRGLGMSASVPATYMRVASAEEMVDKAA